MKVTCANCGKEIQQEAVSRMMSFNVGRVRCPHCRKKDKRYISTFDLYMFSIGLIVVYSLAAVTPFLITAFIQGTWLGVLLTMGVVIVLFVLVSQWGRYVYNTGMYKEEWKDYAVKDNPKEAKILQIGVYAYILVILVVGAMSVVIGMLWLVSLVSFVTVGFLGLRSLRIHKAEKAYYETELMPQMAELKNKKEKRRK